MPLRFHRLIFLFVCSLFSVYCIFAQDAQDAQDAQSAKSDVAVASSESTDEGVTIEEDGLDKTVAKESAEADEGEKKEQKKVNVDFNLGSMVNYDQKRLSQDYAQYFGWLNLPLLSLVGAPLPAGFSGGGLTFTGLDINGYSTTIKLPFGGGVKVMTYNRGVDTNWAEYSEGEFNEYWDEGFWGIQNQRKLEGKHYIERQYDVAWADWGLEWGQNISFKSSPESSLDFNFAYRGIFHYWLEDINENSRQLLFETNLPDRHMSILNKLSASINYRHTKAVSQQFTHGLYNQIQTNFNFEVAPGFMNPNVYGIRVQMRDEKNRPLYYYTDESLNNLQRWTTDWNASAVDNGGVPLAKTELQPTADYYQLNFGFSGVRALWDIAPDRQTNVFSGYITGSFGLRWISELGWDGYIPLIMRSNNPRFKTNANFSFVMNLPDITIMDLKSWSTPRANVGFAKFENEVFDLVNKVGGVFGFSYSREQFNNMVFFDPKIVMRVEANYSRDYDGNFANFWAERDYMFTNDAREGYGMSLSAKLSVRILGLFTPSVGFNVNFGNMQVAFNGGFN